MFAPECTFWLSSRRYVLCSAFAAGRSEGRVLGSWESERVLSEAMRSSEMYALRTACAGIGDRMALHRMSDGEVLRALLDKLGVGRSMHGELVLLELTSDRQSPARDASSAQSDAKTDALVQALARRFTGELIHGGHAYRVLSAAALPALERRESFELLSAEDANKVLSTMAEDAQRGAELRALLTQAAAIVRTASKQGTTKPLVVLRRKRAQAQREVRTASAQTPSQLRKAEATDWLEIAFVSDTGEPMANEAYEVKLPDGATQQGTLDANGMAYLPGIVPGSCEVSFPDFVPKLAG